MIKKSLIGLILWVGMWAVAFGGSSVYGLDQPMIPLIPEMAKTPTVIPPQILNEGRPQGIIIGAISLVIIIIAGVVISFVRSKRD